MANFVHKVDQMGRATSNSNEAKWTMKHPSDIALLGLNPGAIEL